MAEFCCCGNLLDKKIRSRVTVSPCKCEKPGPSRKRIGPDYLPDDLPKRQVEQRDKVGLPRMTPTEREAFKPTRWI